MTKLSNKSVIAVMGLGYVGLPLVEAFSKHFKVIGFDIDGERVRKLTENSSNKKLVFTDRPDEMAQADFIIICVPTPLNKSKEPDLSAVQEAAGIAGRNIKKGSVVILESTVYPGVTEELLVPILEKVSGLKCSRQFKIGYSPERINAGDNEHTLDTTTKVVAGMDEETSELMAELYGKIASEVFIARDIKTAEAAKLVENIQRDLNIALMNEFAIAFEKMGLNTRAVLDAAATKWNFHRYFPGLVGGNCIPIAPQYFNYKARKLGYQPGIIPAGRAVNEYMPRHLAELTIKAMKRVGTVIRGSKILILGLTYKDNVPDVQDGQINGTIAALREYGVQIYGFDPLLDSTSVKIDIETIRSLDKAPRVDAIIVSVAHDSFRAIKLRDLKALMNSNPVLIDVRQIFDCNEAESEGFNYQTL